MPSSVLQKQLNKLNGGKERQKSLHSSLLFERSKQVSLQEIYEIARVAFEEFCVIDKRFNDFLELFSMHRMSSHRMGMVMFFRLRLEFGGK